jgi:hypothetical protein
MKESIENLAFSKREGNIRIMDIDRTFLDQALETLGEVLEDRGLAYDLVVVGGSSLPASARGDSRCDGCGGRR